jgi:hypothetical protein
VTRFFDVIKTAQQREQLEVLLIGMAQVSDDIIGNADGMDVEPQWWDVLVRVPDSVDPSSFDLLTVAEGYTYEHGKIAASAVAILLLGDPESYESI